MGKPRAIRDRKSEMLSCWVCAVVVAIIYVGKNLLIGFQSIGMFDLAFMILFIVWVLIALFYTVRYKKWKKDHNM